MTTVASREQMHTLAERIAAMNPNVMLSDYNDFTPAIRETLMAIREGFPLDRAKIELDGLYDDWESEGFPVEDYDENDDWTEGDPDAFPDPEHAP